MGKPHIGERLDRVARPEVLWTLVVFAATVAVLLGRAPFAVYKFWAEDGAILYQGGLDHGLFGGLGLSYRGYYCLIPRLAGGLASRFPVADAPLVEWLVLALTTGWAAVTAFIVSRAWLGSLTPRVLIAMSVVLLPVLRYEAIGSIDNIQWLLLFPSLLVMISRPVRRLDWVNGIIFLALTALTTPLTIVLAPFAAFRYRYLIARPKRLDAFLVTWAIATGFHLLAIAIVRPSRSALANSSLRGAVFRFAKYVMFENFFPVTAGGKLLSTLMGMLIGLAIVGLLGWAVRSAWVVDRPRAILLAAVPLDGALVWFALAISLTAAPRYAIFPAMCLVWALLLTVDTLATHAQPTDLRWHLRAMALTMIVLLVCWLPHFGADPYREQGPSWRDTVHQAVRQCQDTATPEVVVRVPPLAKAADHWQVRIDCTSLRDDAG